MNRPISRRAIATIAIVTLVTLCSTAISIRRAGAQAPVSVTAADPMTAAQGTINLNVKVTGKGFKNGAKAKWFVTGTTDTGGVTVNSTTFVNSGELNANITVADTAVISNFDIAVSNPDGRGGKGTELFAVTAKSGSGSPSACILQPLPSGVSLVGTLNYVTGGGAAAYGPHLGVTIRTRQMILNGQTVLIVGVGTPNGTAKQEFFLINPVTGQVLDGTVIGSGTSPQPHISIYSGLGTRSLAIGDVNNDGIPDFVAGSSNNNSAGAFVGSVSSGLLSYQFYPLAMPASALSVGWGVAMGDLDGDGRDELAVGALGGGVHGNSSAVLGQVSIFSFNGTGFTNTLNILSPQPNPKKDEDFGKGVAIADVTGTGMNDLIVGAPHAIVNGVGGAGRVFVFPGPVSGSSYLSFTTGVKDDNFGNRVASGDVNGDLLGDLLATSWYANDNKALIYNGLLSAGQSPNFTVRPISGLDTGWATAEPDFTDINGDGLNDVITGAPNAASGTVCGGAAYLYLSGGVGFPLNARVALYTPVLQAGTGSNPQFFGWAEAFAGSGSRLFFVTDHGVDVGSTGSAGQVYIFKLN